MSKKVFLSIVAVFVLTPIFAQARPAPDLTLKSLSSPSDAANRLTLQGSGAGYPPGVVTYFGGTTWNADSLRWEAIEDSVWTFESGVGSSFEHPDTCKNPAYHAMMEGWTGLDLSSVSTDPFLFPGQPPRFRRLSETDFSGPVCVGTTGGLGGNYSLWCGLVQEEADSLCWAAGQGYGNNWDISLTKSVVFDGTDSLLIQYDYTVDSEPGFDFAYVIVDTSSAGDGSGDVTLATYDGIQSGTESLVLIQGVNLPATAGSLRLRFRFFSDGGYSDEDGFWNSTCGAFAVDDILVRNIEYGGGLDDLSDFETGNDGWTQEALPECGPGGDFSRLMALADLPPVSPGPCGLSDSVMVFFDPSINGHSPELNNMAISPWIDLKAAGLVGLPGKILELEAAADLLFQNNVFMQFAVQFYPDTCTVTGQARTSPLIRDQFIYETREDTCRTFRVDLSDEIPPHAEQVRVAAGAINICGTFFPCTNPTNPTPWMDNIRLMVRNFSTLQEAIDAAAPGDTVFIPPGTYSGAGNQNLDFGGKNLVLFAPEGPDATTIDLFSGVRGFIFQSGEDSTSVVCGFEIVDGGLNPGGGAWITGGSHPTFINCRFNRCDTDTGSGVAVDVDSSVRLENCEFISNGFQDGVVGGGVYIGGSGQTTVRSRITGCTFSHNRVTGQGGGLWSAWAEVVDCVFNDNEADAGAGCYSVSGLQKGTFVGCEASGNTAANFGGGFALFGSKLTDCIVTNNNASTGGGVYLGRGGVLDIDFGGTMTGCTIRENLANTGAGVYVDARGVIDDCVVQANSAGGKGGGIAGGGCALSPPAVPAGSTTSSAALIPDPCPYPPTIRHTLITGNTATEGGGVAVVSWNAMYLENCTVSGNNAQSGGAFSIRSQLGFVPFVEAVNTIAWGNCGGNRPLVVFGDSTGVLDLTCSAVDSAEFRGQGTIQLQGPQVFTDPLFCAPESCNLVPNAGGNYSLLDGSPCLPVASPCGQLIGALGSGCATTGIPGDAIAGVPRLRAFPNPFTRAVTIRLVPEAGNAAVVLRIFDLKGRLIREMTASSGAHSVVWDGHDAQGNRIAPGIYFVRGNSKTWNATTRLVRIR